MSKVVLVVGAPWQGLTIHGPFDSDEEATAYQNHYLYKEDFWWIMPIERKAFVKVRITRYAGARRGLPSPVLEDRTEWRAE